MKEFIILGKNKSQTIKLQPDILLSSWPKNKICFHYKHLFEQLVLQLQVNGKQYSISDPVIQSSCGTVPVKLLEYMDMPESTTKTAIEVSHPM